MLNAGGVGVTPLLATSTLGLRVDLWVRRFAIDAAMDTNRARS